MARINHKALESTYQASQGTLDTRLSKGGLKVTTRQIAKVLASHLPYTEVVRSESKAKFSIACDFQEVTRIDAGKAMGLLNQSTLDKPVRKVVKQSQTQVTIPTNIKVTMLESKLPKRKRLKLSQFRLNVDWITTELDSLPQEVKTSLACGYIFSAKTDRREVVISKEDVLQEIATNLLEYTQARMWTVGLDGSGIVGLQYTGFTLNESLAYVKAKYNLRDIWSKSKQYSQGASLDSIQEEGTRDITTMMDLPQEQFNEHASALCYAMDFNGDTREELKVEKLLHNTQITHYASEASMRAQDKELYNNLRDTVEYESQVIGKLDCKSLIKKLPKSIQAIVKRIDLDTGEVKNSHVLNSRERKALFDFRHSVKGKQLLASMQS